MNKALPVIMLCGLLQGCGGLFCKPQEPVIKIIKEVQVVREQVPSNLLLPCTKHTDLPYGISTLDLLNLSAARRIENNSCADQIDNINKWQKASNPKG